MAKVASLFVFIAAACCAQPASAHTWHPTHMGVVGSEVGHLRADGTKAETASKEKKNSLLGGVITGLLIWAIVPICLWNNERIAIKQYKMQLKAERWSVHIDDPEADPIEELDGRIVYLTGESTCNEELSDDVFRSVKTDGKKIKLRRVVEMYQNIEREEKDDDGDTHYTYSEGWCDSYQVVTHKSEKRNPPMPIDSTSRQSGYCAAAAAGAGSGKLCPEAKHENVKVGKYYLGEYVIRELGNWKDKELTKEVLAHEKLEKKEPEYDGGWWYYGGRNSIGTVRVKFEELDVGPLTIVGVLAKTSTGWTFAPIMRPDAGGSGDSFCAEIGGSCCLRVKELHFPDDEIKEDLEERPRELKSFEMNKFHKAETSMDVMKDDQDFSDLCCVGPFGGVVIQLMHWMGLEEQFLGVAEKNESKEKMLEEEGNAAANRHMMMRFVGWLLLTLGAFSIVNPIIKLLTMNWLVAALGGALLACAICCCACWFSFAVSITIMAVSWIAHRPFLASVGIATAVCICMGGYMLYHSEEEKYSGRPGHAASFMQFSTSPGVFMAMTQSLANAGLQGTR